MKKYDALVIGGGAGAKLAFSLAKKGKKVALVEHDRLGGTCLNHGCIPSKMLLHTAELAREIEHASYFDLDIGPVKCRFSDLVQRVNKTILEESLSIDEAADSNSLLDRFHGTAHFTSSHEVDINGVVVGAERIFIASGSYPYTPPIPGLSATPYLTSREALKLEIQPSHLIIIGGGYISAELGSFYSQLGTKVTILTRKRVLHLEDRDTQNEFLSGFEEKLTALSKTKITRVAYQNKRFTVHYLLDGKKRSLTSDQLLVATGIRGSTQSLGLRRTKVKVDDRGFIQVNKHLKTAEKHIWAFGDVIGYPFFRHTANFEADYLLEGASRPIDYGAIPFTVFSQPELARIGRTEKELKKAKVPYFKGKYRYEDSGRGLAIRPKQGLVKLLFSKKDQKLIGGQIVGVHASIMCHTVSAFIYKHATLQDIINMIYIHPSLAEVIEKAAKNAAKNLG